MKDTDDVVSKHFMLADELYDKQFDNMLSLEEILKAFKKVRVDTLDEAAALARMGKYDIWDYGDAIVAAILNLKNKT